MFDIYECACGHTWKEEKFSWRHECPLCGSLSIFRKMSLSKEQNSKTPNEADSNPKIDQALQRQRRNHSAQVRRSQFKLIK